MEAIRTQLKKPLVIGVAGLILGFILGLIWGYVIQPIEWYDAAVFHLRDDLQQDYLRMSIENFAVNGDAQTARSRWLELGDSAPSALDAIKANPGRVSPETIVAFGQAVGAQATAPLPGEPATTPITGEEEKGSNLGTLLGILCLLTLVLGGALIYIYLRRGGQISFAGLGGGRTPQPAAPPAEWTDYEAIGEEPPIAQFMSTYRFGDDLFDESFSIDSPSGEFLGECGVGISEPIGVGDPKKVTGFEVWLFDKNDIQTVTKVLMSQHAFQDDTISQRLAAKGEPFLAEKGSVVVLETATLRLSARIADMAYGEGALPDQSFFDSLILELAVWQKN